MNKKEYWNKEEKFILIMIKMESLKALIEYMLKIKFILG